MTVDARTRKIKILPIILKIGMIDFFDLGAAGSSVMGSSHFLYLKYRLYLQDSHLLDRSDKGK